MADKGGTGTDFFKLTVKVDLMGKSKANKQLQKAFQNDIDYLRQHLQNYPELQSQYVNCVTKKNKHLRFEFCLKSAKALEQLKLSTENDSLGNALSDFSEKKGLGLDIGLGSQHLCFKCKIEEKQYAKGQAHFMEDSSDSSDESDEADMSKLQSSASGSSVDAVGSQEHPQTSGTPNASDNGGDKTKTSGVNVTRTGGSIDKMNKLQSSASGSSVDAIGSQEHSQTSGTPNASDNGSSKTKTTDVNVTQTGSPSDKMSKLQSSASGSSVDALVSHQHLQSSGTPNSLDAGGSKTKTSGADVTQTDSPSNKLLVKNIYLYLPFKSSEIIHTVFIESNSEELNGKYLQPVTESKQLWEVKVHLHPYALDKQIVYHFGVEKVTGYFSPSNRVIKDRVSHTVDNLSVERKFWNSPGPSGFFHHAKHIILHSVEDVKDSISQMEALVRIVAPFLNIGSLINVVKDLQKEIVKSDNKTLLFGVLIGRFKVHKNLIEIINENVLTLLYHTLCQLKRTDVLSTSIWYLHELSYDVIEKKYGNGFCLIQWMTDMFPFQDELKFLQILQWFIQERKPIATSDHEKSAAQSIKICTEIKERIKRGESEKGPELVLSLMKYLPLSVAMKVHNQAFHREVDFKDLTENIVDILVMEIRNCAHKHFDNNDIGKLQHLWLHVKREGYVQSLVATFEKYFLGLLGKANSLNDNYQAFCEDEMLFVEESMQETLLHSIAKSPIKSVHEYIKILAQQNKFQSVIDRVAETWLEMALEKHVNSGFFSQPIVSMYSYLWDAIFLQQARNDAKLIQRLENKLYATKVKNVKPEDLLKIADQILSTSRDTQLAQEIFQQHVMRLLKKQHGSEDLAEVLTSVCGRDVWIYAKWQANLLTTLLDSCGLKDGRPPQETILSMLPQQNFWKLVLKVHGEDAEKVKMHSSYITAEKCISYTRESLTDMSIPIGFIEKVASEDLMCEVASFLSDGGLLMDQYLLDLKDYYDCVIKEKEKLAIVKSTLGQITKYFSEADGLGLEAINEKVQMIDVELKAGNIAVREVKMQLWKPYDSVPAICEKLQMPCKSNVFWMVCKENNIGKERKVKEEGVHENITEVDGSDLEEVTTGSNEKLKYHKVFDINDTADKPTLEGLELLEDLCGKGCDLYRQIWEDFYRGNDMTISDVQEMFRHGVNIPDEICYIEDFEAKSLGRVSKSALLSYWSLQKYDHIVKAMKSSLASFGINTFDDEFKKALQSFEDLAKGDADSITLFQVHHAVRTVQNASCMLSVDAVDLLKVLGMSSTLISFLSDIVDEDIRNLIDAVEEVSEKYVKESTVSGLIEVKRFLHPFLIKDSKLRQNQSVFFRAFADKFQESVFKNAVMKATDCMDNLHNLRSLYNNLANRSERTKEIIQNIIEHGNFKFCLRNHKCQLTVSYKQKETDAVYSDASLVDLRSRALLLKNTARKENPTEESEDKQQEFLGQYVIFIDLGFEIAELCTSLHMAGHFNFIKFDEQVQPDHLDDCRCRLREEFVSWQRDIMQCREMYYYMNFLHGGQIQTLYNYLQNDSFENKFVVDAFLKFIHTNASIESVCNFYTTTNISNQEVLMNIGKALELACKRLTPTRRPMESPESSLRFTESVQKGKLFIVSLDEDSKLVIKTVLSLYQSNAKLMPEAHQVLFCRHETTWNEIELLLNRCLGASKFGRDDSLFCVANVEMLSSEKQFQLVESLRKLPKHGAFRLAIIFKGAEHHPFLHEFSHCVTHVHPMTEIALQRCLQKECSEVFTVTSNIPGLGKTETIKKHAHKIRKKCVTFHVSGPLSKHTLVEKLSKLKFKKDFVLHIDVGNTPNPEELDTFLFELLVLHYVSAYTTSVFLTTVSVCIEIANTMGNTLPDSLNILTSFKRKNCEWKGFESLHIGSELHCPLQVVCHYLNAVDDGTLDTRDFIFKGSKALKPLQPEKCRLLLQRCFRIDEDDMSYTLINSFVRVLADQLKKLSCSNYFRISNLSLMLGKQSRQSIKTDLVKAMVDVATDFATRSIKRCRTSQLSTAAISTPRTNFAVSLAARMEGMIRWEDSNHLMFLFHSQDIQTLSVLYRDISCVPLHVKTLFKSQMKKRLPDFAKMNQKELQDILQKVARSHPQSLPKEDLQEMAKYYALTPDNLLKMVLIMLRIRARIPVILMGETGCGKTSLIQYLSKICGIDFNVKSIHAGVEEEDIIQTVEDVNKKAFESTEAKQEVWLFLDEINTNDHIWLLSDIICHHSCHGRKLAPNLVLMAACNPYRLRSETAIHTAGLEGKARTDELSRLVYRVHPVPETMVDYVWDFGSLSKSDEKMYIFQMVYGKLGLSSEREILLADALVISQEFIRTVEEVNCCVSLRDVRRCTDLTVWFKEILEKKKEQTTPFNEELDSCNEIEIRAIILALAHCYHSRLIDSSTRQEYREALYTAFKNHHESEYREEKIKEIILQEQQDILDRMDLPPGVAKNTALQENVFVILVCILNRIPIFVVGKPGCSKSLSIQVIRSSLRGPDSKDQLFKLLPQLYCVSFQGSESSTSDGIKKVFEKAQKYQESSTRDNVQSVVILDEIGLAEVSRFNPLKVLHSLLEPIGKAHPDVSVVGISNWVLDASKMNRAIHLSRPEMDEEELFITGKSITDSFTKSSEAIYSGIIAAPARNLNISEELKGIARGYFEFVSNQRFRNFYGLRDYYSLVKYFAKELTNMTDYEINQDLKGKVILKGVQRNFGGLPSEMDSVRMCFEKHIVALQNMHGQQNVSILDLIKENLEDWSARHLLLITTGDSVLGILEKQLKDQDREYMMIFGSKFEEDLTDDYSYRILSKIILCMEQGLVLILKDLENVYGSLYDMLNQNYTVVGNKKNCRIALGPYSNPMCHVHDNFKCIVLVAESELDHSDPPFLNRFEKQSLLYSEIMGDENELVVSMLEHWISCVGSISGKYFSPEDIFPIYSKDMTPSLVLHVSSYKVPEHQSVQNKIEACKSVLLQVMKPEAVVRLGITDYGKNCQNDEVEKLKQSYLQLPIHDGLEHFLELEIGRHRKEMGKMMIIFTNSNIHIDLKNLVPNINCQIEKLGAFKSEKQLTMQMEQFWQSSNRELLFLQCKADSDGAHILLSKSIIEKFHAEYYRGDHKTPKHACLIIHLGRRAEEAKTVPQVDFLVKWKLVMLDSLDKPKTRLPEFCKWNLKDTIELKRPLNDYIKEQLFNAFACIRYSTVGRSIEGISDIISKIGSSAQFLTCLDNAVIHWIDSRYSADKDVDSWQIKVSCDTYALYTASSFIECLERHILSVIFDPLAMLINELEKNNLLDSFFISDSSEQKRKRMWCEYFSEKRMFSIDDTPSPTGPECYAISVPVIKLHMPFSKLFFDRIEEERNYFSELLRTTLNKYDADEVEDLDYGLVESLCHQFTDIIAPKLGEVLHLEYEHCQMDYVHDFCTLAVARHSPENIDEEMINVMYWLLMQKSKLVGLTLNDAFTMVHTAYWTNYQLLMAEFTFIETCRELVDIKDILQEIFKQTEEDTGTGCFEERVGFVERNDNEAAYGRSENKSASPEHVLRHYQKDLKNDETVNIYELDVLEEHIEIRLDTHQKCTYLEQGANPLPEEDIEILPATLSYDFCNKNDTLNSSSKHGVNSDNKQDNSTEASCRIADEGEHIIYRRDFNDVPSARKGGSNELAGNIGTGVLIGRNIEESSCIREENYSKPKHLKTETVEVQTVDSEDRVIKYIFSETNVSSDDKSLSDGEHSFNELIKDDDVNLINSRDLDLEVDGNKTPMVSSDEQETQNLDEAPTPQSVLVEKLCRKILPTENVFRSEMDLEKWNKKVQIILSLAGRVSKECSILYALRFCSDLISMILVPYKISSFWLGHLGNLLQRDIAIDSEEFQEKISEMLISFHSSSVKKHDQQKILSQYIMRCLQASENSYVINWILQMVEENAVPDGQLSYLKSPLHYAVFLEIDGNVCQSIFCQILDIDPQDANQLVEENIFLARLNYSIKAQWKMYRRDFPLAILLLDIFEQEIFCFLHPESITAETVINRLLRVERIIFEEEFSLRQLIGIAYFRKFVKVFGASVQKEDPGLNPSFLQKLNACMKGSDKDEAHGKRLTMQIFLLKVLKSSQRFVKLHKMCESLSHELAFLSTIWKCSSHINSADNVPLALYNTYLHTAAGNALIVFESSKDELQSCIRNAVSDSDQMLSLHSVLMQHFFLKRTLIETADSEKIKATEVEELCKECEMDEFNFRLVQCHLGKRDYKTIHTLNLNLHQGSRESDMQIASFVIELASLAVSSSIRYNNFFIECVLRPEGISDVFLPGIVKEIEYATDTSSLTAPKVFISRCISHHRFAIAHNDRFEKQCPVCSSSIAEKNAPSTKTFYSPVSGTNGLVPGRMLTLISQGLLQLIIHGLFAASLAGGYSKPADLSSVLQIAEDEEGVAKYLYQKIETAYKHLEVSMGVKQTDFDYFLHALCIRTKNLMWEDGPSFKEECERNDWERKFTSVVSTLVQERFVAVHEAKRQALSPHTFDGTAIEHQVEEIKEGGWCPCFFRLTNEPSLENLSLELYERNEANSFPFLALVLKALPQLELIQHIKPLLSWHRACVMYASYHMKKADCKKTSKTVSDFIHWEEDPKRRRYLQTKFESCKKSWDELRKQAESVKELSTMDRLHSKSELENCLILDKSSPMYRVLETLVFIQNNFLDKVLVMSVENYIPALHFLQKNTSIACVPCIPLADVMKDHIIQFQWSEHFLKFSQCNLLYGQGREIAYDFRTIEVELANSLLLGKCYLLLEESFPRIIFTDELFKTYILMIQELKDVIAQQKLAPDIAASIRSRKERDPKLIADFFTHLGIIMSLLRRTGGKPETPLIEFLDNWSTVLTRPFPRQVLPNPEDAIQLCHIVELHELLEELNADGIIDSLEDEYRVPLEGSSQSFIDGFLGRSVLMTEVVLKAEKRFAHLCLLHREVPPVDSLLDCLSDNYFWPDGSLHDGTLEVGAHHILLEDLFPQEILVGHIHSYIMFLTGKMEYLKSKELRISHGPSTQSTPWKTASKNLAKKKQKRRFKMEG